MDSAAIDFLSKSPNRKVHKLLGRAYLHENRIEEALDVYLGILRDHPDDPDVLLILGNLYRLAGCPGTAEYLYSQAEAITGQNAVARKQSMLARTEYGEFGDDAACPIERDVRKLLSAEAIVSLASRLRSANAHAAEICAAADMVEKILPDDFAGEGNGRSSEETQQLLPALIDLNIRQARAAGYSDLAEALQSLQINLTRQVDELKGEG